MNKIICIGSSGKDIFFPTAEGVILDTPEDLKSQKKIAFEMGAKYHIEDRFETLGGCAVNQSVGLLRLGVPAACYTVLGSDMVGEWIEKEIKKEGVNMDLLIKEDCPSGLSAIIVDQKSGERIIFSNQEANERMKVVAEKMEGAEWISVSDLSGDWQNILDEIMKVAHGSGAKVVFNPRGKNIQDDAGKVFEISRQCDVFFINKDEAIEILAAGKSQLDNQDEKYLIREIKNGGAKIVVMTDGTNGAWATDGQKIIFAEAQVKKAVDTTGGGDAFSSGFLAAYVKGKSLEECLQWGTANGGNSVKFYGGVEGLLRENEIEDKIKDIEVKNL
ncbi:MAG: carbohydrate kinase family protein [Parcubacteria group bacterium]